MPPLSRVRVLPGAPLGQIPLEAGGEGSQSREEWSMDGTSGELPVHLASSFLILNSDLFRMHPI